MLLAIIFGGLTGLSPVASLTTFNPSWSLTGLCVASR